MQVEDLVIVNEAISYKVYEKGDRSASPCNDAKLLNCHHIHPIGDSHTEVVNGFLKHVKKAKVDFSKQFLVFFIDYSILPELSPPIHDPEEPID